MPKLCFLRIHPQEEAYWEGLERSGAAWAVTTIDAPYIVMHATAAWYKMFNIKHSQGEWPGNYLGIAFNSVLCHFCLDSPRQQP